MNLFIEICYCFYDEWIEEDKENIVKNVLKFFWRVIYYLEVKIGFLNDLNGFFYFNGKFYFFY